ncbi:mantle protein-like isoform X2 [Ostrea edulis]|uniref:mantle protein-like isoform X2 n=1 Tax=Ostrea edulis TaxID=37623 RepID=UPI0024AFE39B|nr:mantle protein-like isoform X2 [Ostrea edulis]
MIAAILLTVVVGALAEPSVHVVPHAKKAVHEVAHDVNRHVGLVHQVPFIQREVKIVRNEVPRFINRPKIIRRTRVHVQKYNYDKPYIRKHTIIKPVQVVKKFDVHKTVDVPRPIHKVRTVVKPVHVDRPYPQVIVKKKVQYKENRIFRPKPVFEERVHIKKQHVPIPITEHVFKNIPQPRLIVKHVPFDIVKHVHQVKKEPVAVARVKTIGVQVPVIDRKRIHVPVAKSHGGGYVN